MTLAPGKDCKKFGSSCDLSEKFFKEAVNGCGILEKVLARGMEQHNKTLAKTDGKIFRFGGSDLLEFLDNNPGAFIWMRDTILVE